MEDDRVFLLVKDEDLDTKEISKGISYGDVFEFYGYVEGTNYDYVIAKPIESKCKEIVLFHVSQIKVLKDYEE